MDIKWHTPIESKPVSVWKIRFNNGKEKLIVATQQVTARDIVNIVRQHHPGEKFLVSSIASGVFNLDRLYPSIHAYMVDRRTIDHNLQIHKG